MAKSNQSIEIKPPLVETVLLNLVGDTPLIVHKFSEKSKKQMRDKQAKKAKNKKIERNAEEEYEQAKYKMKNGKDGFPVLAIKRAIIGSARFTGDVPMTVLRGTIFIMAEEDESGLTEIKYDKVTNVEDMVRVGNGSSDFRYRPYYYGWSISTKIKYDKSVLSIDQIVNLITRAGLSQGLGDWRPEKNGQNGQFHVDDKTIQVL